MSDDYKDHSDPPPYESPDLGDVVRALDRVTEKLDAIALELRCMNALRELEATVIGRAKDWLIERMKKKWVDLCTTEGRR